LILRWICVVKEEASRLPVDLRENCNLRGTVENRGIGG
jgi:hypothetical protein